MAVSLTTTHTHSAVSLKGKKRKPHLFYLFFRLPPKSLPSCVVSSSPLIINESNSDCSEERRSTGSLFPVSFSSITGLALSVVVARVLPPSSAGRSGGAGHVTLTPTACHSRNMFRRAAPFDTHLAGAHRSGARALQGFPHAPRTGAKLTFHRISQSPGENTL